MMNYRKRLLAASLVIAAASLATIASTSYASAQCMQCAMYPDRDPLNGGAETPYGKMNRLAREKGTAAPNVAAAPNTVNNAHAEMRGHRAHRVESPSERTR